MFEECLRLFDTYYQLHEPDPSFNTRAGTELKRRIEQLEYLLAEVRKRVDVIAALHVETSQRTHAARTALEERGLAWSDAWPPDIKAAFDAEPEQPVSFGDLSFEVETVTEAFYFVAGRLRQLLRKDKNRSRVFPGLGDLPHDGAARVRDKLIEHYQPDGDAPRGVAHRFGISFDRGPALRLEQTDEPDAGLYTNAEKLADDLTNKLRAALRRGS